MEIELKLNLMRQNKEAYGSEFDKHRFEQYKLYVEMTDRISARRMLANSFFIGIHTTLITVFTVLLKEKLLIPNFFVLIPLLVAMLLCLIWSRVIDSYRQLNSSKFKVVHLLEEMLPAAPYKAEWVALGEGKNPKLYRPLTNIENWVPTCFTFSYLFLVIAFLFMYPTALF